MVGSAILLAGSFSSMATVPGLTSIYSDFGAGFTYSTATAWGVEGASESSGYRGQAEFFTPSVTCNLNYIKLATYHAGGSSLCNYFIAQDDGSGAPGTILESFTNVTSPTGILQLNSVLDPQLTAGTQYWLCMEPATSTTSEGWFYNNQGVANGFAYEHSEWGWTPFGPPPAVPNSGVFQIAAVPVPEPSTAAMLALGTLGLARLLSFRRAAR